MKLVLLLLSVAIFSFGKKPTLGPTKLPEVRTCKAEQSSIDGKTYWWHVHVTDSTGTHLYAIRYGTELNKALKDCSKWLKRKNK